MREKMVSEVRYCQYYGIESGKCYYHKKTKCCREYAFSPPPEDCPFLKEEV